MARGRRTSPSAARDGAATGPHFVPTALLKMVTEQDPDGVSMINGRGRGFVPESS
jgi:hypothetical protein